MFVLEPDLSLNSDGDVPLLIDMEHQAKSLEDMVLVVQSAVRVWDSPHACNGREIRWQGTSLRPRVLLRTSASFAPARIWSLNPKPYLRPIKTPFFFLLNLCH